MRTKAGILVGSGDQSHKYGIPLPPPYTRLCWPGLKIWKGGVHAVKIMIHYRYKFLGVIHLFGQFKEEKLMQLGSFFWRETEISFIKKILATDELRSHVTIPLGDKSRYDLIVKINEKV